MAPTLRYSVIPILIGVLSIPQADARGGGGGSAGFGGGFRVGGAFHGAPGFRHGNSFPGAVRRPGFVGHQPLAPFAPHGFRNQQFARNSPTFQNGFPTGFPNTFPVQNGFPWRGGWSGPVGGWGWPGDWWPGGYYGYAYPPPEQVQEPQVIVIHADGNGRMTTAEAPADYSYVKGCHAIANGYHCDTPTAAP